MKKWSILSWNFFGKINAEYLFGKKALPIFTVIALVFIVVGSFQKVGLVWDMSDMFNGLMVLPNLLGLLALSNVASELIKDFEKQPAKAK